MIQWAVLTVVKVLKIVILGAMTVISNVADSKCCNLETGLAPSETTRMVLVHHSDLAPGAALAPVPELSVPSERLERIGRLVPPVRVEITFSPDLLRPPTRDPSI